MTEKEITCINCPVGCRMTVRLDENGNVVSVSGNTCNRGHKYAIQECTSPQRMITAVVPVKGSEIPLSVKTAGPVPKAMIHEVMQVLSRVEISVPVRIGEPVVPDILGTGIPVVATRNLPEE